MFRRMWSHSDTQGSGSVSPWAPTDISGIKLWLRSDLGITKDGSDFVSSWADQSVNGNDVVQANPALQPTWVLSDAKIKNLPIVRFDGISTYLQRAVFTLVQPFTVYLVLIHDATAAQMRIFDGDGPGTAPCTFDSSAGRPRINFGTLRQGSPNHVQIYNYSMFRIFGNGTSSSLQVNGLTSINTINAGSNSFNTLCIGASAAGVLPFNGKIAEMIIYDTVLLAANILLVEDYIVERYGAYEITTPTTGTIFYHQEA